jgi:hypothetical protein
MEDLAAAAAAIQGFSQGDLTARVAVIEAALTSADGAKCTAYLGTNAVTQDLLDSAYVLKRAAGRINDVVHAIGIMLVLPHILQPDERVEYVSLAAGNTGKPFDLETTLRVAEFKFIAWQGGPEVIRQNSLFKDFYLLAEAETSKRKVVYVLGTEYPLKFLKSGRSLVSVMSRNAKLWTDFANRYGERFRTVGDYYAYRHDEVILEDVGPLLRQTGGVLR